jgi:hypothetical protein
VIAFRIIPRIVSALRTHVRTGLVAAGLVSLLAPAAGAVEIPSDMHIDFSSIVVSKDELVCLALNDYWEARSESLAGRIAVARVVLNRAMDPRFPSNLCEVIKQTVLQNNNKRVCQFSWFCDGKTEITEPDQWRQSLKIAVAMLQKDCSIPDPTGGALWYHADFIRPAWAVGYESTTIIGNHVFYRDADGQHTRRQVRKPFIYRLNAFAESVVARHAGKTTAIARNGDGLSTVAVQGGPAPTQPLAR